MKKTLKIKPKRNKKDIIYFFLIHYFNYIGLGGGSIAGDYMFPLVLAIRKTKI